MKKANQMLQAADREEGVSQTVIALGFVSLFMDMCSEMVYTQVPIFLKVVLGVPASVIGLIEGIAESSASLMRLISGHLSDISGRRKPFALLGYSMGALTKPLMALVTLWPFVLALRLIDRLGKGIRSAPRDALITETTPIAIRGKAFGMHRAMDTAGAVLGPLLGFFFLIHLRASLSRQLRLLFLVAGIPGILAVLILCLFVKEPIIQGSKRAADRKVRPPLPHWRDLDPLYRKYLLVVALFNLGNFSDAFMVLRAHSLNFTSWQILLLYSAFNLVEMLLSYKTGRLSDRVGRQPLITAGYLVFAIVCLGMALSESKVELIAFFLLYGLYYTLTQGVQRALAADFADPNRRAAQIGVYHAVIGIALLPASLIAGLLYDIRPSFPFFLGASIALISAMLMSRLPRPAQPLP